MHIHFLVNSFMTVVNLEYKIYHSYDSALNTSVAGWLSTMRGTAISLDSFNSLIQVVYVDIERMGVMCVQPSTCSGIQSEA